MASTHFHSTLPLVDDSDSTSAVPSALDTESLSTLASGQGAQVTTRENAADAAERARGAQEQRHAERVRLVGANRPTYARHEQKKAKISLLQILGLAVAIIAVVAVLLFVFSRCAGSVADNPAALSLISVSGTQAAPGQTLTYDGESYELTEKDGSWKLVSPSADNDELMALAGKPVVLMANDEWLLVPENLDDGTWDVMAIRIAEGAVAVKVPDAAGEGKATKAEIDDATLVVTTEAGETVSIPLE